MNDKMTDAELSKIQGRYQAAESIGIFLGALCVIAGCVLAFVLHELIVVLILGFSGVVLLLLIALPAQKKKNALIWQQLGAGLRRVYRADATVCGRGQQSAADRIKIIPRCGITAAGDVQLLRVGSVTENAADLCVRVVRERGEIHIWPVLQFKLVVQRLCAAQLLNSKIEQLAAERCDGP